MNQEGDRYRRCLFLGTAFPITLGVTVVCEHMNEKPNQECEN